ncbi:MAG: DUF4892 domain-containing protein [Pseudomonadales bacterium]
MARWSRAGLIARVVLFASLAGQGLAADSRDLPDTQDFDNLPRFPGAWISASDLQSEAARTFVLGPVERKRREVRIAESQRLQASLATITYELPRTVDLADVVAHYQNLLSGRLVYQCSGRDCGRSNDWANTVFSQSSLYGPDGQQRYLAADLGAALLGVYVIRRGNQRVFVHLAKYTSQTAVHLLPATDELDELVLFGRYRLQQVLPRADGTLSDADTQLLQQIGARILELPIPALFVVCHLHPAQGPPSPAERRPRTATIRDQSEAVLQLVQRSEACAEQAAAALSQEGGPKVLAFGVGPLAPSKPRPRSHLELILPNID